MKDEFIKKEEVVSCEDCKCLLRIEHSNKVERRSSYLEAKNFIKHYCNDHKKPYEIESHNIVYGPTHYYKKMEVDKLGEPVGYKKIR